MYSRNDRWLARAALALALLAVLVVIVAGAMSLPHLIIGVLALAAMAIGAWWLLTRHGTLRVVGLVLAIAAPLAAIAVVIADRWMWILLLGIVLWAAAIVLGRTVLYRQPTGPAPRRAVASPRHPVLIMNPKSGGGKVEKFDLADKAKSLGAEVILLDPDKQQDVEQLARDAVASGADLLGVAGGDGTQALVAQVAVENELPFLVISAGTRNHFALDLGLDRSDPASCLDALRDGVEVTIDLGQVNDRPFVNTVSFGAYAAIVQSPEYRDAKARTILKQLPDLLTEQAGHPTFEVSTRGGDDTSSPLRDPLAVLVSNNPYATSDLFGLGRRPRLDRGELGFIGITLEQGADAARIVTQGTRSDALHILQTSKVIVDSPEKEIPVAVDGEALTLTTPVVCTVQAGALRVRLPRQHRGWAQPLPVDWRELYRIARNKHRKDHDA